MSSFVAKNDEEKAIVRSSVGPVWDGNEVWLLTAGGALFAAFAPAYATTFSGFYLAIMLVLMGLIVRAVSLEFAGHDKAWSKLWNASFFVGSLFPRCFSAWLQAMCSRAFPWMPTATTSAFLCWAW